MSELNDNQKIVLEWLKEDFRENNYGERYLFYHLGKLIIKHQNPELLEAVE